VNGEAHTWKACWGQPLASSNLASSATSDQAIHKPRSCVRPGPARLRSLICSLIYSTHISIKRPMKQAHASECYRGCGRPLDVPALSDQLAAVAVTMGERLGGDDAGAQRRSPNICGSPRIGLNALASADQPFRSGPSPSGRIGLLVAVLPGSPGDAFGGGFGRLADGSGIAGSRRAG
jgi:hypothetical protein